VTLTPFAHPAYVMLKPIGSACNLSCSYCYYLEKQKLHGQPRPMSMELLEKFTRQYIAMQTMLEVLFTWHGGEPLLLPVSFYEQALRLQRRYGRGRPIDNCIQTNGTLLNDEWCRFLKSNNFLVGLSIDGPQQLHDHFRQSAAGTGSWQQTMRAVDLLNRHGFYRELKRLTGEARRMNKDLTFISADLDGLKYINDNYGHKEGDFALQRLAGVIKDCSGSGRICARFGGDEFIILGSDASEDDASAIETAFYAQMENINSIIKKPYSIDASIGTIVTEVEGDKTLFNLITQADEIMYAKKKRKKTSRYLRRD
jgi:diguanylate cyclase (GGDEF)-like protein